MIGRLEAFLRSLIERRWGIYIPDGKDLAPLPAGAIGPKGMPAFTPLERVGRAEDVRVQGGGDGVERDLDTYDARGKQHGSARRLRNRVAVLDLRIASAHGTPWTKLALRYADEEAAATRAFLLEEAARREIADLSIDVIPWFVTTELPEVTLRADERGRPLTENDAHRLKRSVFAHVSRATGVSVPAVVAAAKKEGYAEVAVMLRLPTKDISRELALTADVDGVDAAVLQQPIGPQQAAIYAHELLHLFGADDLYRIAPSDPADDDDIMGESSSAKVRPARVRDATAWAIGWQSSPPERAYAFGPHRRSQRPRR